MAKKKSIEELLREFTFDPLPKGLKIAKPIQDGEYDEEEVYELERNGRLIIEVKDDGWKTLDVKTGGQIKIYTDGPNLITDRIPHIAKEMRLLKLPDNTFLLSEGRMVVNGGDDRGKVSSVLNFNTTVEKALAAQKIFKMWLMVFDVMFWDGRFLLGKPYIERLGLIQKLLAKDGYIRPPEVLNVTFDEAKRLVVQNGWEGVVLYDKEFKSSFRLDGGSPERPDGCYKWKPLFESDFFVREWVPSEENPKLFKEILLLQIDPKTGKEVDWGKHGVFSKEDREEIQVLLRKKEPVVVQFEFEARTGNNKLTNKRFVCVRYDKKWPDCVMPVKLFPKNMKPRAN